MAFTCTRSKQRQQQQQRLAGCWHHIPVARQLSLLQVLLLVSIMALAGMSRHDKRVTQHVH
jgi:hypothetical protein